MRTAPYELHFAPLQGYTDAMFRNAFAKYFGGVDVYYTPFIRVEREGIRRRDLRGVEPEGNAVPRLMPQILPGSPEEFRMLTDAVAEKGYTEVDINLGCPFPLIAGRRKGAGMLPYPEQVEEVVRTVEEYPGMRFSLKMRLGWEGADECLALADLLNSLRLSYITVHARTGKQQYKGVADPEAFAAFYERAKHPLFYNGDLRTVEDIRSVLEKFPRLRGVSVGRGLLSSPFVAADFKGEEVLPPEEREKRLAAFHRELFAGYAALLQGDTQLLTKMKTLWEYFLPGTDRKLLKQIKKSNRLASYTEAVKMIFGE